MLKQGLVVVLVTLATMGTPAVASEAGLAAAALSKQFTLEGGINVLAPRGRFGSFRPGTDIGGYADLEDLNFDSYTASPLLLARWRATERVHFGAMYQSASISGGKSGSRAISFPPISIPAGYNVQSDLDVDRFRASAGYAFWIGENYEYGFGGEYNWISFGATLDATASIGSLTGQLNTDAKESFGVPAIFAFGSHAVSDRVSLEGRFAFIKGTLDTLDGGFLSTEVKANYHIDDRWAVSGGLQYIDADFTVKQATRDVVYDLSFPGLFVLAVLDF